MQLAEVIVPSIQNRVLLQSSFWCRATFMVGVFLAFVLSNSAFSSEPASFNTLHNETSVLTAVPSCFLCLGLLVAFVAVFAIYRYRSKHRAKGFSHSQSLLGPGSKIADVAQRIHRIGSWSYRGETGTMMASEGMAHMLNFPGGRQSIDVELAWQYVHPDDRDALRQHIESARSGISGFRLEHRLVNTEGETIYVEHYAEVWKHGRYLSIDGIVLDISSEQAYKRKLDKELFHCELTGLKNRIAISQLSHKAGLEGNPFALLLVDLSNLKRINESLGFVEGDKLIQAAAERICCFEADNFQPSHIGGGLFACAYFETDQDQVRERARELIESFNTAFTLSGLSIYQPIGIGIACFPFDASDFEGLLSCAHTALNEAKKQGRNQLFFYSKLLHARMLDHFKLEAALDSAINNQELELVFQAKVCASTHKVMGAEALLRWNSETLGSVSPQDFIAIAERTDAIIPIGRWVIQESCRALSTWKLAGFEDLTLSFNISPKQFTDLSLVDDVITAIANFKLQPQDLEVEITEDLLAATVDGVEHQFNQLRKAGVRLTIDDFGRGYSSLGYLKDYVFDGLKIDKSFIESCDSNQGSSAIIKAIIGIASALNMKVTAEGVQSQAIAETMAELHCDALQGFYFAEPMTCDEFLAWLAKRG